MSSTATPPPPPDDQQWQHPPQWHADPQDPKAQAKADKAARPWYRKKRFILPLATLVLIIFIGAIGGETEEDPTTTPAAEEPAAEAPADEAPADEAPADEAPAEEPNEPGIGTPVRDGKFEFTVTGVERIGNTVGEDFLQETAQGEFVIVRINVTNIGNEAGTLSSSGQVLHNDQDQEFEPSSEALFSLEGADDLFLQNINPGNTVTGAPLLYDVPPGTVLNSIELHDSIFSGGATVSLEGS